MRMLCTTQERQRPGDDRQPQWQRQLGQTFESAIICIRHRKLVALLTGLWQSLQAQKSYLVANERDANGHAGPIPSSSRFVQGQVSVVLVLVSNRYDRNKRSESDINHKPEMGGGKDSSSSSSLNSKSIIYVLSDLIAQECWISHFRWMGQNQHCTKYALDIQMGYSHTKAIFFNFSRLY